MTVQTFKSDDVRLHWRDRLDDVFRGASVIIERYSKPIAVLIGFDEYEEFQRFKEQKRKHIDAKFESLKDVEPITFDELDRVLDAPTN